MNDWQVRITIILIAPFAVLIHAVVGVWIGLHGACADIRDSWEVPANVRWHKNW